MKLWLKKHRLSALIIGLIISAIFCFYFVSFYFDFSGGRQPLWGVTYSPKYAVELNLDWQKTFIAILDELKVDNFRLVAYWDEIETVPGTYDFTDLDWQIDQASRRSVAIILVIGRRTPRWPECHDPVWLDSLDPAAVKSRQLQYLETVVKRYRDRTEIKYWQVENEPLLAVFGECPKPEPAFLKQEIDFVKSLDSRMVITTDSGELSSWQQAAKYPDIFGTTLYRIVWNKYLGFWRYFFIPPAYYHYKASLTKWLLPQLKEVIVTELQMEPWTFNRPMATLTYEEQLQSFDQKRFRDNIEFTRKTGLPAVYLWGVEYWYWLKEQGRPGLWQEAGKLWQ